MIRNKIGETFRIKPALPYLEVHLVDHCNLNCKGCGHFSLIGEVWFADLDKYVQDMSQLKRLFFINSRNKTIGRRTITAS